MESRLLESRRYGLRCVGFPNGQPRQLLPRSALESAGLGHRTGSRPLLVCSHPQLRASHVARCTRGGRMKLKRSSGRVRSLYEVVRVYAVVLALAAGAANAQAMGQGLFQWAVPFILMVGGGAVIIG